MKMSPAKVVFHVGAHKTATSFLQNWLHANSTILMRNDISASTPRNITNSKFDKFCFELSKPRARTISNSDAEASLFELWKCSGGSSTYVVSKENVLGEAGRLYINAARVLSEMKKFQISSETNFIFYVRRNDHFIESHALQQYSHGKSVSIEKIIESMNNRTWISVVNDIEDHFPDRVQVEFYEKIEFGDNEYISRFCDLCNIDRNIVDNSIIPDFNDQNRSLSRTGLGLLMQQWDSIPEPEREGLCARIRVQHHTGVSDRPSLIDDSTRRAIIKTHEVANRSLIAKYGKNDPYLLSIYCQD